MFRSIIAYVFLAGLLWAQDVPPKSSPTGGPSTGLYSVPDAFARRKERADREKQRKERQDRADYDEGLAKRFAALNDALQDFQKAYIGAHGELWPQKEVEQVKKAWRSLKKFEPRFDEDKHQ